MNCCFLNLKATQTSLLLEINSNTINRYYNNFHQAIYAYQESQNEEFVGALEVDESYFGRSRIKGEGGIKLKGRSVNKQPVLTFMNEAVEYTPKSSLM